MIVNTAYETEAVKNGEVKLPDLVPALSTDASEYEFANLLQSQLPPVKTVGTEWFAYLNGNWQKIKRDTLRPVAQSVLPESIRTARRESTLLEHLEGRLQANPDSFRGFYCFDESGNVLLNVRNGVVKVTPDSIEMQPHSADHLFTRQAGSEYNPKAKAELFRRVLEEALPDPDDRLLLQLCCGNFLLPDCRFETALVCYGEAGRGKSTIADPISTALGVELVARLSMSQICDPKSYHLPKLRYAAVNLGTELGTVTVDESANFKTIVSGEPIEARPIYGEPFTMFSTAKLWFLANGLPRFKHGTEAELRRTRFIRFDVAPTKKDVTLKSRLLAEKDGVFGFMIEGLQMLLGATEIPLGGKESKAVHERFRVSNDPVGAFVESCCQMSSEVTERKEYLRSAFVEFSRKHELPDCCAEWFFKALYERFTNLRETQPRINGEKVRCIAGIRLKSVIETD
ncbi:MAG: phage/plasmid primase, P4 family [Limisphaerales bacterium]